MDTRTVIQNYMEKKLVKECSGLSEAVHFAWWYWSSYLAWFSKYKTHNKVNNEHKFAILNFTEVKFLTAYPPSETAQI